MATMRMPQPELPTSPLNADDLSHSSRQHGAEYLNGKFSLQFECLWTEQTKKGQSLFGVFEDEAHWDLVEWIVKSGLSTEYVERLLNLKIVSNIHDQRILSSNLLTHRDLVVQSGLVFKHLAKTKDQTKRSSPVLGHCGDQTAQRPRPWSGPSL
jgi:hypothetical protein